MTFDKALSAIRAIVLTIFIVFVGVVGNNGSAYAVEISGMGTVNSDSSLNVRTGPGKEYDSMGKVYSGNVVEVIGMDESEAWFKITYNGTEGYVSADYIDFEPNEEEFTEEEPDEMTAESNEPAAEENETEDESTVNYKMVFGLLGAIVVLFIIILITIKSIKNMDSDDDYDDDDDEYEDDDEYDDSDDEYDDEQDDEYEDEDEEDDDAYEYETITIRRPKQSTMNKPRQKDDYLIDIDPRYFDN